MTVSVIIPAYNASATIERTISALKAQDFFPPIEVIVVNDGSTDNTAGIVRRFESVTLINQSNAGPAAARNAGALAAHGDILCFTDSDCVPHSDWITWLVKGFSQENVCAVCGSYGIANPGSILARGIHAEIIYRHRVLVPDFPKVFGSYNFGIKKEVFKALSGFNTQYRCASGEDNDLSYRLIAGGGRIFFARGALVDHYHTTRLWKYLKEQSRHGYWRMAMYADHPQMARGDGYTFWKDVLEVPWSFICVLVFILMVLGVADGRAAAGVVVLFILFEWIFALIILNNFFESFFYGFVMFFRAFARSFGLSTGILYILSQKKEKKVK